MKAKPIASAAIIGAGTMGAGIAGLFARAGSNVTMVDLDKARLEAGLKRLDLAQQALVDAGRLSLEQSRAALDRVLITTSVPEVCESADIVLEAVIEDMDIKKDLLKHVEASAPPSAILASNTSGLSITSLAAATQRPDRVVGMHFWNPPHLVPLVEVTRGRETSSTTANAVMDAARRLGKKPILVRRDVPGFVGNRIQFAVLREALHLLAEGVATAEDIDTAVSAGPGLRWAYMGPLRTADFGGLDVFNAISEYLFADLAEDKSPPGDLPDLVGSGHLGAKSGKGFYTYEGKDLGEAIRQRDRVLLGFLKALESQNGTQQVEDNA